MTQCFIPYIFRAFFNRCTSPFLAMTQNNIFVPAVFLTQEQLPLIRRTSWPSSTLTC